MNSTPKFTKFFLPGTHTLAEQGKWAQKVCKQLEMDFAHWRIKYYLDEERAGVFMQWYAQIPDTTVMTGTYDTYAELIIALTQLKEVHTITAMLLKRKQSKVTPK